MMHDTRRFCVGPVESPEELAEKLTGHTWTLCTGFTVRGFEKYLFLNDATHEDGAGEFGVIKRLPDGTFLQIESITFSWCDEAQALTHIQDALAGKFDASTFARPVSPRLDTPEQHGRCHLCE